LLKKPIDPPTGWVRISLGKQKKGTIMMDNGKEWADGTESETGPVLNSDGSSDINEGTVGVKEEDMADISIKHVDAFLTDHGRPSPDDLEDLVLRGTPEAWEELRGLADQYDILVDDDTSPKDIAEKVRQAMDNAEDMVY
jgi:hypothetical protein